MSLRIEGTTLGGFKCDEPGCSENGIFAPMMVVPWLGLTEREKEPITCLVNAHACAAHFSRMKFDNLFDGALRKGIAGFAEERRGVADFARAKVVRWRTVSARYLEFLQSAGVVPKDDAMVKGSIEAPPI